MFRGLKYDDFLPVKVTILAMAQRWPQRTWNSLLQRALYQSEKLHTGVQGTCAGPRNLSDAHIKRIAAQGGVIGIGYFEGAVCGLEVASIVKAIRYTVGLAGVQHVALGSDFDGATKTAFDTTGLVLLTQGLLESGFSEQEVADIMGGNVRRLLGALLPGA